MTRARPSESAAGIRVASTGSGDEIDALWILGPGVRPNRHARESIGNQKARRPDPDALGFFGEDHGRACRARAEFQHFARSGRRKKIVHHRHERPKETTPVERTAQRFDDGVSQALGNPVAIVELKQMGSWKKGHGFVWSAEGGPLRPCVRSHDAACGARLLGPRPGARLRFG